MGAIRAPRRSASTHPKVGQGMVIRQDAFCGQCHLSQ